MGHHATSDIRNIAFVGHSGVGKTSLIEALLAHTGMIGQAGTVERGSTVSDYDALEKEHGHSLDSAVCHAEYRGKHLNLLDTPGYPDFRGPTLTAMAAVETVAVVINAQSGIEHTTRRLMHRAKHRRLCRMIVINRIDMDDVDLPSLLDEIRDTFGAECLPINLPCNGGESVRDVFFNEGGETDIMSAEEAHTAIIDQVVEMDEGLMEKYFEDGRLDPSELHDTFERALRRDHLVPICFVSAKTGAGIEQFLEVCDKLLPNPTEANLPPFVKGEGEDAEPVEARPDPDGHVLAHVFKVINDPFVGKLSIFRIYQGTVSRDSQLYIGNSRKPFKVGHLLRLQGKDHEEIERAPAGDICAVAKVDEIHYDDVLHDSHDEDHYHLEPLQFPQAMFGLAIEPKSRGQEQKISTALTKLSEEDPCFVVDHNAELNETVIRGLGDLHLRIMLERMEKRFGAEVKTRPPRIAYRETITKKAEGHYRHKKQTGGAGQFGEVFLRVAPLGRGEGFEFENKVVGGAIPSSLIPAVEKGVRQVLGSGAIAGYPIQDVKVTVYDGKHHPVDSKEIAFVTAGKKAFLDAISHARAQVLEPIVDIHVTVPEQYMGDVTGSLAAKRARISGTSAGRTGTITVDAQVPLSEVGDFQTELKAMTGGTGRYSMEFSHYDPVPGNVQQQLIADYRPREEDN